MIEQIARHGGLDLDLTARGDLDVDQHHTVEDVGIALGEAVKQALGSKRGILRAGYFLMPMDDCLAIAALDFSGRVLLRLRLETLGQQSRRFSNRIARGFLPRLRAVGGCECSSEADVRPLVASPGRVDVQSIRKGTAVRRYARPPNAPRLAFNQGATVKIAIVDYGAGNLPSVERALRKLGAETEIATRPRSTLLRESDRAARRGPFLRLRRRPSRKGSHFVAARPPMTPACRFSASASACRRFSCQARKPRAKSGLGFLPGRSPRAPDNVKSPHIGWNQLERSQPSKLLRGIPAGRILLFRAFLRRARFRRAHGRRMQSWFPVRGRDRAAQFDRRAVPPGKVGRSGRRALEQFRGDGSIMVLR